MGLSLESCHVYTISLSCTAITIFSIWDVLCNCCFFPALHKRRQKLIPRGRAVEHSSARWTAVTGQQWHHTSPALGQDKGRMFTAAQIQLQFMASSLLETLCISTRTDWELCQHKCLLWQNAVKEFSSLTNTQNTKRIKPWTSAMGTISKLIKVI